MLSPPYPQYDHIFFFSWREFHTHKRTVADSNLICLLVIVYCLLDMGEMPFGL